VLIPALVLPVQVVHPPAESWLRRLCRAILEDVLACLEGKGPSSNLGRSDGARRAGQAGQWFASEATYLFSFTLVCAVLNLDAQAVRRQVGQRALKDSQTVTPACGPSWKQRLWSRTRLWPVLMRRSTGQESCCTNLTSPTSSTAP